jgi:hypothetical protein
MSPSIVIALRGGSLAFGLLGMKTLEVLRVAQDFGHLAKTPALDSDLFHQAIDHRRLYPITQRRVDDLVCHVAARTGARAIDAIDVKDLDGFDLLQVWVAKYWSSGDRSPK